jgi:hypothetical protein
VKRRKFFFRIKTITWSLWFTTVRKTNLCQGWITDVFTDLWGMIVSWNIARKKRVPMTW